jgi:hypothetical protein
MGRNRKRPTVIQGAADFRDYGKRQGQKWAYRENLMRKMQFPKRPIDKALEKLKEKK